MTTGGTGVSLLSASQLVVVAVVTGSLLAFHWLMRNSSLEHAWQRSPIWFRAATIAVLLFLIVLSPGDDRAFIYFQF
jgi:molybdopterin biosynthesis enzyme MoaB